MCSECGTKNKQLVCPKFSNKIMCWCCSTDRHASPISCNVCHKKQCDETHTIHPFFIRIDATKSIFSCKDCRFKSRPAKESNLRSPRKEVRAAEVADIIVRVIADGIADREKVEKRENNVLCESHKHTHARRTETVRKRVDGKRRCDACEDDNQNQIEELKRQNEEFKRQNEALKNSLREKQKCQSGCHTSDNDDVKVIDSPLDGKIRCLACEAIKMKLAVDAAKKKKS